MNLILFEDNQRAQLYPFTQTRPIADIRCGILTMRNRWEKYFEVTDSSSLTISRLQEIFPLKIEGDNYFVNGSIAATEDLVSAITNLKFNSALKTKSGQTIAFRTKENTNSETILEEVNFFSFKIYDEKILSLSHVWDIFSLNEILIEKDFQLLTNGKFSQKLPEYVTAIHPENIFISPNVQLNPCIINASEGSVFIDEEAEIMDGCLIRGPFCLGKHATLKMGAKVYGGTTIGPHCKVGGEVNNVVFFNYSNKGHDGFIGNAVIGDWCNLGADTNCSNLKNNYDIVKIWDEYSKQMISTGLQFCGLIMGDHSKCGINTMFNTGTVVGVSCNIFGAGFPEKYIPDFTWGGVGKSISYKLDKAMDTANRMMARRGKSLSEADKRLWKKLYQK